MRECEAGPHTTQTQIAELVERPEET